MLWLALFLPEFPLQSALSDTTNAPLALYETKSGRQIIVATNALSAAAGIETGMTLASAESLLASLQSIERHPENEIRALQQLAQWAQQFTPLVSLQPPNGLLLDIEASLSLFQGLNALQTSITKALQPLGYSAIQAVAPTADAAWLLATAGITQPILTMPFLQPQIAVLPISLLSLSQADLQSLKATGIKTMGECLQLSRSGLTRRFGSNLLRQIDQILGQRPNPRECYAAPPQFHSQIMLPNAVHETEPLLFVLQRLLHQLTGFLRARTMGTQEMRLGLIAPQQPVETLTLGLLSPSSDPAHLLKLWQEKLDKHQLQSPIEGVELLAPKLLPMKATELDLFVNAHAQTSQSFIQFLERLRNRLGNEAIRQLHNIDEHRADKAFKIRCYQPQMKKHNQNTACLSQRPLWLLPQPQRLKTTHQGPWLQGLLKIMDGPERIESGWWDDHDQRRDYYIARSQQQQTLWIYQNIKPPLNWYLHGLFG